jgi:2-dehydropantoate 2-reductase
MKIAIMGSGGTGGYYGAHLAAAGHDVTFIARGTHLQAMLTDGLRLSGPRGDIFVNPAQATANPGTVGHVDVVLFCVKLYDTETAAELIRPLIGPESMIISVQNGVDGAERIDRVLGGQRALGGSAYVSAKIMEPGVIGYTSDWSKLVFGENDGKISQRVQRFADACRDAGFEAEISSDIDKTLWSKFVLLATNAAMTTLTRQPLGVVYGDADLCRVAEAAMREVRAVATARGVALDSDIVEQMVARSKTLPPDMTTSMHHDLSAGKPLEIESFSGLVAQLGDQLGVATPVHRTAYACLKPYRNGQQ